jgi:cytoplasmic iron level regulating protein YaaA (DUF328/UPF0246 family)
MNILLISCSERKNPAPGLLPAFERYTGGMYQVVHRAQREGYWPADCRLVIVSAHYGLLSPETPIACYDCKMTRTRAALLQTQISSALDQVLTLAPCDTLFLNLGSWYRVTVQASHELEHLRFDGRVLEAHGGLGERLSQTKRWLKDSACLSMSSLSVPVQSAQGKV